MYKSLMVISLALSLPVSAQSDSKAFELDGVVGVVSDYREKGVSLTNQDFGVIGNFRATHKSGLYGDIFMASTGNNEGADFFADATVGYKWQSDAYDYSLAYATKSYHGDLGSRYFPQIKGAIARDFGLFYISGGVEYAPEGRWISPDIDSFYTGFDVEVPLPNAPDITFISHVGYDFRDGRSNLWDWQFGLSAFYKNIEFSLIYDDSSLDHIDAGASVVFGAKWYF